MAKNLNFDKNKKNTSKQQDKQNKANRFIAPFFILLAVLFLLGLIAEQYDKSLQIKTTYSEFFNMVEQNQQTQQIKSVQLGEGIAGVILQDGSSFSVNIPPEDDELIKTLRKNVPDFTIKPSSVMWLNIITLLWPLLILGMMTNSI